MTDGHLAAAQNAGFKVITREACVLMEGKMSSLLLLDDQRQWLDLRASHGAGRAYVQKPRLSVEESLLGIVVRTRSPSRW